MKIITRKEALALGLKRYFTGKPCPKGHVCERFVSGWTCVDCTLDYSKEWQNKNPEKAAKASQRYRDKNKEKVNHAYKKWYKRNKHWHKSWRLENKEKVLKASSFYRKRNPEKVNANNAKRRALKSECSGSHTAKDIANILKAQKNKCANCLNRIKSGYHVDHVMPLALGGSNGPENLQCLCPTCNLKKHAKHPIDWARENGRLI